MTLALILGIVFLLAVITQGLVMADEKRQRLKKTKTNIPRQDELWVKWFKIVVADIEDIDKKTPMSFDNVIPTIETLFYKYSIPDLRPADEKARFYHMSKDCVNGDVWHFWHPSKAISNYGEMTAMPGYEHYPQDSKLLPTWIKICPDSSYTSNNLDMKKPVFFDKPELLFGEPNKTVYFDIDGNQLYNKPPFSFDVDKDRNAYIITSYDIRYDQNGRAWMASKAFELISQICNLCAMRDIKAEGFNFSYNRQGSLDEWSRQRRVEYAEYKEKYPWLYK